MASFFDVISYFHVANSDNHLLAEDGVGGREGSFSMCTFWLIEALTRAGKYDKSFIAQAVLMFEDMVTYSNHLGLYSEEITRSGEVVFPCFMLMEVSG